MAFKNYQGERDFSAYQNQYKRVIGYLVNIENHYPELYSVLVQTPQFEYDIEICRSRVHCACRYLSVLEILVEEYVQGKKLDVNKLIVWRESVPAFG